MAYTLQQVVDRARIPLNDADKVRYADTQLLEHVNEFITVARRERPDLFFGQFEALPAGNKTLADTLPVDDEYFSAVADYVSARAELKDDEAVNTGRAAICMKLFEQAMYG